MSIPSIDFSTENASLAFKRSLEQVGFSQITNYGIDQRLLKSVFDLSKNFFIGEDNIKHRCRYLSAQENFGYQGLEQENLDPSAPPDLKETFTMRNILNQPPELQRWPSEEFRDVMQSFYRNALESSFTLMQKLAIHLDVDLDHFVNVHSGENIALRLLHYQAPMTIQAKQLGAGAHTDYGFLTLLFQQGVEGLQVAIPENTPNRPNTKQQKTRWVDVPATEGVTVVNSGDLLERWTNGRFRSTLHRVKPPTQTRLSIAFFLDPDSDTIVSPLPSCTRDSPQRYQATTAGEHIQQKLNASHLNRFIK